MSRNRPKYLLDECVQTADKTIRTKFGFVNLSEIIPNGSDDDKVLRSASRRNLTIITKDIRFVLQILIKGKPVVYENYKNERIHIIPKTKPRIERNCHFKYKCFTTYYIQRTDNIIMP